MNDFDLKTEKRLFDEGLRLFNAGEFFEAHDTWEEIWRSTLNARRERFYRGIIQVAVTLELLRRGRAVGVRQVFVSCQELLAGYPPVFMGIRIASLMENLRGAIQPALEDLETREVRIDPARLFQIELEYDAFASSLNGEDAQGFGAASDDPAGSPRS